MSNGRHRPYPDGGAGAIYGLYPPMVNPCLPEGQWNTFDVVFEAPRFDGDTVVKPTYLTVFLNGLVVHNRVRLLGSTAREPIAAYTPHWIRRLPGYDA